jgi:hypothetical protein
MIIKCEMFVSEFFKLSVGHIALVGTIIPDIDKFIPNTRADLYIGDQKVKTINIIGEDRFSGGDAERRQGRRSVRTDDDITDELKTKGNKEIKLVIYINK